MRVLPFIDDVVTFVSTILKLVFHPKLKAYLNNINLEVVLCYVSIARQTYGF